MRKVLKVISVCIILLALGLAVHKAIHSPETFWNVNATGISTAIFAFLFTFFGADELERVRKINEIYKKLVFDFLQDLEQIANGLESKEKFFLYKNKFNNRIILLKNHAEKCGVSDLVVETEKWYSKWERAISEKLPDISVGDTDSKKYLNLMQDAAFKILFKL